MDTVFVLSSIQEKYQSYINSTTNLSGGGCFKYYYYRAVIFRTNLCFMLNAMANGFSLVGQERSMTIFPISKLIFVISDSLESSFCLCLSHPVSTPISSEHLYPMTLACDIDVAMHDNNFKTYRLKSS